MPKPTKQCANALKREMRDFMSDPPPHIPEISVNESNILEWHYLIEGPPDSPYEGGWYIGKLKFPHDYPFKPPGIMMLTPNGRFKTGERLCLSMSDFHPETWNPMWSVSTVLTGLLSFMLESTNTTGALETTLEEKRRLAADSLQYNLRTASLKKQFPEKLESLAAGPSASGGGADGGGGEGGGGDEEGAWGLGEEGARALEDAGADMGAGKPDAALERLQQALGAFGAGRAPPPALVVAKARSQMALGDLDAGTATLAALLEGAGGEGAEGSGRADWMGEAEGMRRAWEEAAGAKAEGNAAFRSKDYAGALPAYQRAIEIEPGCSSLHANLAAAFGGLGRHEEAAGAATRALELYEGYSKARRRLADHLSAAGRYGEAAAEYALLVDVYPGDAAIGSKLAACMARCEEA